MAAPGSDCAPGPRSPAPADYLDWLAERRSLRGLLQEAGDTPSPYAQGEMADVVKQSIEASRQKLARLDMLIAHYEAAAAGGNEAR
jgi:hypothetical protein